MKPPTKTDDDMVSIPMSQWIKMLKPYSTAIEWFVRRVNREAERKMLMTGKLEDAHCAAMTELLQEIKKS